MPPKAHMHFRHARLTDLEIIKSWWHKPYVQEFWDNSLAMWQNCENYLRGIVEIYDYWLGFYDNEPYALIMTSDLTLDAPAIYRPWLSDIGATWSLDFMIGNEAFLGKGLAHLTLQAFVAQLPKNVQAFIIDPDATNKKAIHVYQKAGFEIEETFAFEQGEFEGKPHYMMRLMRFS